MTDATISEEYRKMQQELHQNPNYGVASLSFAPIVAELIRKGSIQSVADYGAGKKNLLKGLQQAGIQSLTYKPYDPAFPEYGPAQTADLVCCIDVLEHIEPELLDNVLKELGTLVTRFGFFSIHMGPAAKTLSDGRNAHLVQQPSSWWLPKLCQHFEIMQMQTHQMMGHGIWVIVQPRKS